MMPTKAELEAAARVLCRLAFFQLPVNERPSSADDWPDHDVEQAGASSPVKRWQTFTHEARLALEAAEQARTKPVHAAQIRSVIDETRKRRDDLVAAGVDRVRLENRLSEMESHLDRLDHDPVRLHFLLSELRTDLIEVESKLIGSGALQTLHQILGTGVPSPR